MQPLQGTVISNPDAPLRGHRVEIVARQRDARVGHPAVRCSILDGPVLGATSTGLGISDVEWDDPAALAQWLRQNPEPTSSKRRGGRAWHATAAKEHKVTELRGSTDAERLG